MASYVNTRKYDTAEWWRREARYCEEDGNVQAAKAAMRLSLEREGRDDADEEFAAYCARLDGCT